MEIWTVKRKLFRYLLSDKDNDPKLIIHFIRGEYKVSDPSGTFLFSVVETKPYSFCFKGSVDYKTKMTMGEEHFPFPARAVMAELTADNTDYTVFQQQNRDFIIRKKGDDFGTITDIMKKKIRIMLSDETVSGIVAMMFIIADRMFREDDIPVI